MPIRELIHSLSRLRVWLFLYATRVIEFVNALFIIGFSLAFVSDFADGIVNMYSLKSYKDFSSMGLGAWLIFMFFGVAQLAAMGLPSLRSTKASALILMTSGAIWALIAGAFITSHQGFITTAPYVYGVWSVATCCAGYELISASKRYERLSDGGG